MLTISIPIGLQFGGIPGDIVNRSIANEGFGLEVLSNQTLALIGGNVFLEGGAVSTIDSRIEIGSVNNFAFVDLVPIDTGWLIGYGSVSNFQDIRLSNAFVATDLQTGNSSEIVFRGRQIIVSDNSEISIFNYSVTSGNEIAINASELVEITEDSDLLTRTNSSGASADIIIKTKHLIVKDNGSSIDASTESSGRGGNLIINATELVEVDAYDEFNQLSTQTFADGDAGNLTINTKNLLLRNGSQILSPTDNVGNGGEIIINAYDFFEISRRGIIEYSNGFIFEVESGVFSETQRNETVGNGGNISINTSSLKIQDGGTISVAAVEGSKGRAGNLEINANSLFLNEGTITAETAQTGGEEGANINIEADLLTLQNESQISATASGSANGGNINIDANFVIAFPNKNNDIIAKASAGIGGNIDITTNGIFGIAEKSSTPPNNTNDIDPSSDFGLDGTVNINELEVNPAEGLAELPTEVIDVARLVETNLCQQGKGSEFVVTGKGGIAPSPTQTRDGEVSEVDLVEPVDYGTEGTKKLEEAEEAGEKIVEAQGWIVNDRGTIELVAHATDISNLPSQPNNQPICPLP